MECAFSLQLRGVLWSRIRGFLCKEKASKRVVHFGVGGKADQSRESKPLSETDFALRAQKDPQHFEELFERFFRPMYRFFFFRIRQHEDAEDLTSETFEKVFLSLHRYDSRKATFGAWIFTIAHHCLIDHIRKQRRHPVQSIDDLPEGMEPSVPFDLEAIDQSILKEKVWKAMRTLSPRYQQLWALKITSGLSHREIAAVLKTSENNVNVMVHRSLADLRLSLSPPRA